MLDSESEFDLWVPAWLCACAYASAYDWVSMWVVACVSGLLRTRRDGPLSCVVKTLNILQQHHFLLKPECMDHRVCARNNEAVSTPLLCFLRLHFWLVSIYFFCAHRNLVAVSTVWSHPRDGESAFQFFLAVLERPLHQNEPEKYKNIRKIKVNYDSFSQQIRRTRNQEPLPSIIPFGIEDGSAREDITFHMSTPEPIRRQIFSVVVTLFTALFSPPFLRHPCLPFLTFPAKCSNLVSPLPATTNAMSKCRCHTAAILFRFHSVHREC